MTRAFPSEQEWDEARSTAMPLHPLLSERCLQHGLLVSDPDTDGSSDDEASKDQHLPLVGDPEGNQFGGKETSRSSIQWQEQHECRADDAKEGAVRRMLDVAVDACCNELIWLGELEGEILAQCAIC